MKYIDNIKETLNQIKGEMEAAEFLDSLKETSGKELDEKLSNYFMTAFGGLGDGIESWEEGISEQFDGEEVRTVEEYKTVYKS